MATFNANYFYGIGLRTCPFNPNHKVKDSKYIKHLMKCEQQFPNNSHKFEAQNGSKQVCSSVDSISTSSAVKSFDALSLSESSSDLNGWNDYSTTDHSNSVQTIDSNVCQTTDDSAIEVNNSSDKSYVTEDNVTQCQTNDKLEDCLAQSCGSTQTEDQIIDKSEVTERPKERVNELTIEKLIPKEVTESKQSIESKEMNQSSADGSGDPETWSNGKSYSLYDENIDYNNLTDEQIMEMTDTFVDIVVLTRMSKPQRNKFNEKLLELKKAENKRKLKAFNELVAFRAECDSELKDIPEQIRQPKVDIRKLFNLKRMNNKFNNIYGESSAQISNNAVNTTLLLESQLSGESSDPKPSGIGCDGSCAKKKETEGIELNTFCNCCSKPMSLNELNIKRITVFCAKCSGIKFGGYFECHSCKLYGYFAKNKITEHMAKHFPLSN